MWQYHVLISEKKWNDRRQTHSIRLLFFLLVLRVEIYCLKICQQKREEEREKKRTNSGNPLWHLTLTHNVLVRHQVHFSIRNHEKKLMNERANIDGGE